MLGSTTTNGWWPNNLAIFPSPLLVTCSTRWPFSCSTYDIGLGESWCNNHHVSHALANHDMEDFASLDVNIRVVEAESIVSASVLHLYQPGASLYDNLHLLHFYQLKARAKLCYVVQVSQPWQPLVLYNGLPPQEKKALVDCSGNRW